MRVLTFLHSFELGGVERIALRLIREWRQCGADAPLYVARRDGAMAGSLEPGIDYSTGKFVPRFVARCETLWMIATLPGIIRRERPDILFCAGNTYSVVAVAMKIRFGPRCPPIVAKVSNDLDRRDLPWLARFAHRLWLRIVSRYIDHAVAMADPARCEISERLGLAQDRISVIPDPALSLGAIEAARESARARSVSLGKRRYVCVGRLAAQKNIALMLRAFRLGSEADDKLTIIGDGPQRPKLVKLATRLGIAHRVSFVGYVDAPIDVLPTFDALLLSSDYEGVPAVLLEALAADLEIVVTNCSRSIGAILLQGELGELVPIRDEKAFAQAIARVRPRSRCPELRLTQARRFTIEHSAYRYLDAFARTASRSAAVTNDPARPNAKSPFPAPR